MTENSKNVRMTPMYFKTNLIRSTTCEELWDLIDNFQSQFDVIKNKFKELIQDVTHETTLPDQTPEKLKNVETHITNVEGSIIRSKQVQVQDENSNGVSILPILVAMNELGINFFKLIASMEFDKDKKKLVKFLINDFNESFFLSIENVTKNNFIYKKDDLLNKENLTLIKSNYFDRPFDFEKQLNQITNDGSFHAKNQLDHPIAKFLNNLELIKNRPDCRDNLTDKNQKSLRQPNFEESKMSCTIPVVNFRCFNMFNNSIVSAPKEDSINDYENFFFSKNFQSCPSNINSQLLESKKLELQNLVKKINNIDRSITENIKHSALDNLKFFMLTITCAPEHLEYFKLQSSIIQSEMYIFHLNNILSSKMDCKQNFCLHSSETDAFAALQKKLNDKYSFSQKNQSSRPFFHTTLNENYSYMENKLLFEKPLSNDEYDQNCQYGQKNVYDENAPSILSSNSNDTISSQKNSEASQQESNESLNSTSKSHESFNDSNMNASSVCSIESNKSATSLKNETQSKKQIYSTSKLVPPLSLAQNCDLDAKLNDSESTGSHVRYELHLLSNVQKSVVPNLEQGNLILNMGCTKPFEDNLLCLRERSIVRIQKLCRRALIKLYLNCEKIRYNSVCEMIENQAKYVKLLQLACKYYMQPLITMEKTEYVVIDEESIRIVFGCLEDVLKQSKIVLEMLYARFKMWHYEQTIGDVWLKILGENLLDSHVEYIKNYSLGNKLRMSLTSKYPDFAKMCAIMRLMPLMGNNSLEDLLITPIQRIPRYVLLLLNTLQKTRKRHPDYKYLSKAFSEMQNFTSYINENNREYEARVETFLIANRLCGLESVYDISNRKLLHQGPLYYLTKMHRMGFLFDNALILAKEQRRKLLKSNAKDMPNLKIHKLIDIQPGAVLTEFYETKNGFVFSINETTFMVRTEAECKLWISKLSECILALEEETFT